MDGAGGSRARLGADPRDPDAALQAVRFELYRENIYGALEMLEAAHAAHPDPRYAEQIARIRSWLGHLVSREAYIEAQDAQYRRLRWRAGLKLLEKRIRMLLGRKTRKMIERRGRIPSFRLWSGSWWGCGGAACLTRVAAKAGSRWRWPRAIRTWRWRASRSPRPT